MAYRSSSSTSGATTTITVPVPAGAATNDIAILVVSIDNTTHGTITWPSGFTEFYDTELTGPDGHTQGMAWKRLTGADSGNYTITYGNGNDYVAMCVLFSGRDTTNPPVHNYASSTSSNTSPISVNATAVTASDGDDMMWVGGLDVTASGAGNGCAAPTNYTECQDVENGWANASVATRDNVSAGSTGTVTGTYSLSSNAAGWQSSLIRIPAAAASGQPTAKRHGGVPYMALPGRGNVWAPVMRQTMLIGPTSPILKKVA